MLAGVYNIYMSILSSVSAKNVLYFLLFTVFTEDNGIANAYYA